MIWIPELLQPFTPIMAMLAVCCGLALALALHRVTNYARLARWLPKLSHQLERKLLALKLGRMITDTPLIETLCDAVRSDGSEIGLGRFHRQQLATQRQIDEWVDRGLSVLIAVAPMLGLAGTVCGMILAFREFAAHEQVVTLRELGEPVSIALKTTLYGVCCAAACATARRLFPVQQLHREEDLLLHDAGRRLQAAFASQSASRCLANTNHEPVEASSNGKDAAQLPCTPDS
jgi:biopolymer transport protein ExbB/TolQ